MDVMMFALFASFLALMAITVWVALIGHVYTEERSHPVVWTVVVFFFGIFGFLAWIFLGDPC